MDPMYVDYGRIYESRFALLRKAYERSDVKRRKGFKAFCKREAAWLDDYALYTEIKAQEGGKGWDQWEDEKLRNHEEEALKAFAKEHEDGVGFVKFQQYLFAKQWKKLKAFANKKGIQIVGDIPIYVAFDSSDAWARPELFQFDEDRKPVGVAGCPPDVFSATGQLWGNPLYNWDYHEKEHYAWWIERIRHCMKLYDVIRIDHFRGFDEYYSIPYGDPTAEFGKWMPGPGMKLFKEVKKQLGDVAIIAEDLGILTESVCQMLAESGYPGMKILEFAFSAAEPSTFLPHNYDKNCIVYTGTHDNETLLGWVKNLSKADRAFACKYLGRKKLGNKKLAREIIRLAHASTADTCIIPLQDYLELGNEARVNHPSTVGGNWTWRLQEKQLKKQHLKKMKKLASLYGRIPAKKVEE